ncbi:MAG: UDP-N-acetylmuramate--L-alanine ligase [Alphaproteobacteria bacterium]|nr:UDP-N-acetylmuramate--L-alanine ligase [Alphaproteobacteria bacterium]
MFKNFERNSIIHFIGIGGIGMSGIAEILHCLGFTIQGSDLVKSSNVERIEKLGIKTFIGHEASNVNNADIVVYSSAVTSDNVELCSAKKLHIPCLTRAEMLSQIARFKQSVIIAGSHGKTTVTSLSASLLEMANMNPTVINGGIINSYGSNAKLGNGDWIVLESDESDGSFMKMFPTIAIVTNIDKEHIYYYGSFKALKEAFKSFLNSLPFYGTGIVCIDDDNVKEVINEINDRKILTYGFSSDANIQAFNIKKSSDGSVFDAKCNNEVIQNITIPLFGDHNIRNALSIVALSRILKIDSNILKSMLSNFSGVKRRFTKIGYINDILVIDDYAHHPTEIKSLILSAKQHKPGRVVLIHQPHRFRRLNQLFDEFCNCLKLADISIILPVYKANDIGTAPLDSKDLYKALLCDNQETYYVNEQRELEIILLEIINKQQLNSNDIIVFSGAGSISKIAHSVVCNIGKIM